MNMKEVKEKLGISTPTVYKYVEDDYIKRIKNPITGRVTYDRDSVLELKKVREGK